MKVIVLCGFLGSGKTTFLQSYIAKHPDLKLGVIMNEISLVDIDGLRLNVDKEYLTSVVNGSIFCSCKSDQFIDQLLMLSTKPLDYILVESSGLADPSSIQSIVLFVETRTNIDFQGIITMIAAPSAHKLLATCIAVKKQIEYASCVFITKSDLALEHINEQAYTLIQSINPTCKISSMIHGEYDPSVILDLKNVTISKEPLSKAMAHQKCMFQLKEIDSVDKLHSFFQALSSHVDRIKGFVNIKHIMYYLEYIDEALVIEEVHAIDTIDLIVVITTKHIPLEETICRLAKKQSIQIEMR